MTKTKNYGLEKPDSGDFYDVSVFSRNMDIIDRVLGGLKVCFVTPDEYGSQPHDPNTLYYVVDDGQVSQYLGDAKLGGGSGGSFSAAGIIYEFSGSKELQGNYTNEETEE